VRLRLRDGLSESSVLDAGSAGLRASLYLFGRSTNRRETEGELGETWSDLLLCLCNGGQFALLLFIMSGALGLPLRNEEESAQGQSFLDGAFIG